MAPIITLTTDFGETDGYVASMKGVILSICPTACLVDVTHLIQPQDIRSGSYILKTITSYFPAGTVHLAVVDPGVGSTRKALAIKTENHLLIGPDNGLFSLVLENNPPLHVHSIEEPRYMSPSISATFHGRDIFAPAAAHVASGVPINALGPACPLFQADWGVVTVEQDCIRGEIIHIDRFGNCVTNIERHHLQSFSHDDPPIIEVADQIMPLQSTYGDAPRGKLLALLGSCGHIELALSSGHAASFLDVQHGDRVSVCRYKL